MMIDKRLVGMVPDSKKYIAGNVCLITKSHLTLCKPMNCSLIASVHGISQTRMLE